MFSMKSFIYTADEKFFDRDKKKKIFPRVVVVADVFKKKGRNSYATLINKYQGPHVIFKNNKNIIISVI